MSTPALRPALLAAALAAACGLARAADEPMLAYTVSAHDTLIGLNRTLFASPKAWPEVARINRLPDPNKITPGQVLMVPSGVVMVD